LLRTAHYQCKGRFQFCFSFLLIAGFLRRIWFMRKPHLCAFLSLVSIAALQTWPAAAASPEAGQRQLSQERWMLHQDGARTSPRSEVRVHFFNPNQVVRVAQKREAAPTVRPLIRFARPAPAVPERLLVVAASPETVRLAASHTAGQETRPQPLQPDVRSRR
jgi:hypothetical protein